ncbi:hypothetical protein SteCoe_30257 [Stentor coeruleus]|uniref:Uncharacterized protein n=1 Tax=Stentor coeruleus TaxID=5963 RepID=A0A1R2B4A6_9CILI|nr:hypothetical protein SteCoe_30257 [Stentor coeruleus]
MIGKDIKARESMSLKTDDIPGASPQLKGYQYTNKLSYINSTTGIDKSSPHSTSFTTNRQVNPLNPNYILPSSPPKQYTPPKFIRDTLDTHDIQGTSPTNLSRNHIRNTLDVSDIATRTKINEKTSSPKDAIPGTSPKAHVNVNFPPHNRNFDVSDIQGGSVIALAGSCTFEQQKLRVKDLMNCKIPIKIRNSVFGSLSGNASPNSISPLGSPKNGSLNNSKSLNSLKTDDTRKSIDLKKQVPKTLN